MAGEDTCTKTFTPRFQTLKIEKEESFMDSPVITLDSGERIVISFDEIGEDHSELQWRLIHCNADWQPSRLLESEVLNGFNLDDIEDYAYSASTFIHYVNYRFTVPSEKMQPFVSGNYLVQVFDRYEPSTTLLQARIRISETKASISGRATGHTDKGNNTEYQQLSLNISLDPSLDINPYQDIIVTVEQNGRPESLLELKRPLRANGHQLIYESLPELIFEAGNEFRRFETVRADYPGLGVDSTRYVGPNYHAWVALADPRAGRNYVFDKTQHGRFKIDEYNSTDPDLGADYVTVHFTLDFPEVMNGDIFIDGELTHHLYGDTNRMVYNRETGLYELQMPLKQGSYNYQYVVRRNDGNSKGTPAPVEGNYSETENEYLVSVYLRTPVSRGDRLLGTATIISEK